MIEVHDDWYYLTLWYVLGSGADYTVLVFRRAGWGGDHRVASCEAIARFRFFKTEAERQHGVIDGTEGWFEVPAPAGAGPDYVVPLAETLVKTIADHPELGPVGAAVVYQHTINSGGSVFRDVLAGVPWAA